MCEGAEKLWGSIRGQQAHAAPAAENEVVSGAIRTDLILSAEIMVIALNEVADQAFVPRLIILIVVALVLTVVVYGVVAVIVKMDDVGLYLTATASRVGQKVGRGLVAAMPKLLWVLSTVGVVAMFWVGGHILREGIDHLGWHALEGLVGHAVESVGAVLAWLPTPQSRRGSDWSSDWSSWLCCACRRWLPDQLRQPARILIVDDLGPSHTNGVPLALSPASVAFPAADFALAVPTSSPDLMQVITVGVGADGLGQLRQFAVGAIFRTVLRRLEVAGEQAGVEVVVELRIVLRCDAIRSRYSAGRVVLAVRLVVEEVEQVIAHGELLVVHRGFDIAGIRPDEAAARRADGFVENVDRGRCHRAADGHTVIEDAKLNRVRRRWGWFRRRVADVDDCHGWAATRATPTTATTTDGGKADPQPGLALVLGRLAPRQATVAPHPDGARPSASEYGTRSPIARATRAFCWGGSGRYRWRRRRKSEDRLAAGNTAGGSDTWLRFKMSVARS